MNALNSNIKNLEKIIGYSFKSYYLISIAISHPGLKRGSKGSSKQFERLEFLGDRVLGLSLCDFLYRHFESENEGNLAVRIAALAGTDFLINLAKKTKIIDCFCIPKDFFVSNNKNSSSIADMIEAMCGALFLDAGFEVAKKIISNLWKDDLNDVAYRVKDSKTRLQEKVQAENLPLPVYRLVKRVGAAHDPVFEIEVTACGKSAIGYGNSKRIAEHDAAEKLLLLLDENEK